MEQREKAARNAVKSDVRRANPVGSCGGQNIWSFTLRKGAISRFWAERCYDSNLELFGSYVGNRL
jgi:hypothetical protein